MEGQEKNERHAPRFCGSCGRFNQKKSGVGNDTSLANSIALAMIEKKRKDGEGIRQYERSLQLPISKQKGQGQVKNGGGRAEGEGRRSAN